MKQYFCEHCFFKTNNKTKFLAHHKTKKHILNERLSSLENESKHEKYEDIQKSQEIQHKTSTKPAQSSTNLEKSSTKPAQTSTNPAQKSQKKSTKILKKINLNQLSEKLNNFSEDFSDSEENFIQKSYEMYKCDYCNKILKSKDNLTRHIRKYCITKKKLDNNYEQLKNKEMEFKQEKNRLYEQIERLLEKVGTTNITNNTLDNSTTNTHNQNITLNNFGEENLEVLTNKFMNNMIMYPFTAIPKMIKKVHFNELHPENNNIRMVNKKDNKLQIRKNNQWEYVDKKDTVRQLIDDKNCHLDKYYEDNKNKYSDIYATRYQKFQKKISDDDKNLLFNINKDMEIIFWNNMYK